MNNNRALEFLEAAQRSFPLLHDRHTRQACLYVELAMGEVQELLDQLAELQAAQTTHGVGGVLIVDAMTQALLSKNKRALGASARWERRALPENKTTNGY